MTGRIVLAIVVVLFPMAGTARTTIATVSGVISPVDSLSLAEMDAQVALRASLGLRTDRAFVNSVASDAASEMEVGIPVTAAEGLDLRARGQAQAAIADYKMRAEATVPGYAGFYVDQKAGGTIVLMATVVGADAADALLGLAPKGIPARRVVVSSTLADLEALHARLDADRGKLAAEGIVLNGVGVDIPNNVVVVGVHPLPMEIADRLKSLYPGIVVVDEPPAETSACVSRLNCMGPLRAGLQVSFPGYLNCTSSFVASTGGTGSNVFLLTAAHCAPKDASAYHNGVYIGKATRWNWQEGGLTDSLAIDVAESQRSNLLYITNDSMISITARQSPTADYPGQIICQSGVTSNVRCGTLWGSETQNFSGVILYNVRRVTNMVVQHGDSGGPTSVYQTGIATGIVNGSNYTPPPNARGWYTHIYYAEDALNLFVCRSMACTNF